MRYLATSFPAIFSVFMLVACGGCTSNPITFDTIDNRAAELVSASNDLSVREPSALPLTGEAAYSGVLGFTLANGESYDGFLDLAVDLGTNSLQGSVSDFVNLENGAVGGTLTVSNGTIDRSADITAFYSFGAGLDGILSDGGNKVAVDGFLVGQFLGDTRHMVSGVVRGDVFFDGDRVVLLDSAFVAECSADEATCNESLIAPQPTADPAGLAAVQTAYDDLRATAGTAPFTVDLGISSPTVGSASYVGVAELSTTNGIDFLGDFDVTADFLEATLSGEITNVFDQDAHPYEGSLDVAGFIDQNPDVSLIDIELSGDIDGTLQNESGIYVFDAYFEGYFRGDDGQFIRVYPLGDVTINGVSQSLEYGDNIYAERQ